MCREKKAVPLKFEFMRFSFSIHVFVYICLSSVEAHFGDVWIIFKTQDQIYSSSTCQSNLLFGIQNDTIGIGIGIDIVTSPFSTKPLIYVLFLSLWISRSRAWNLSYFRNVLTTAAAFDRGILLCMRVRVFSLYCSSHRI